MSVLMHDLRLSGQASGPEPQVVYQLTRAGAVGFTTGSLSSPTSRTTTLRPRILGQLGVAEELCVLGARLTEIVTGMRRQLPAQGR